MPRSHAPRTIFTFILGVSVGAVTAMLLAPKAGEEMRADISAEVIGVVGQVRRAGKVLNRRAQKIVALAQDHVQDAIRAGQAAYSQAKKA
jgi:gas vesicle protein